MLTAFSPYYNTRREVYTIVINVPFAKYSVRVEKQDNYHRMHLGFNENTCRCLSIVNPEHAKPVFAVEYEYIFENGSEKDTSKKPRSQVTQSNPSNTWPNLDFENLPKCLSLTELEVYELQIIDLCGRGINKLGAMIDLPNLRELNLSYNKLTAMPDSSMLKHVRKLDVSFNEIQSFEMDTCLPLLESLNAAWNNVSGFIESLESLKTITPNLIMLNVKHNPFKDVIKTEATSSLAQAAMPSLKCFNGEIFCHTLHAEYANQHPWIIDHFEMADLDKSRAIKNNLARVISEPNKRLTSPLLINDTQLENVQYANLVDNQLSSVEFIAEFQQLKEIYLANNLLTKILLHKCANNLTKLSLCCNFVVKMDGIIQENLPVLKYLDLSNNLITSLISMGVFHTLTEFYCSHNNISTLSEVCNLKNWTGLKIVDISSNPIDSTGLCKKFIIFHISKVEVR
ncbi:leucine-rich repeat-containing protein 9-like [Neodiprion pinetum]|uniref:leucine-rich repeat-containing protein 9-like n=1 Tax=Neodiprion pinetum TaxID=441929 RepID=UPI001EDDDFEA|nr:leucine-rich repeat-containing protein 9-like [Neodiprion pinetum]